MHRELCLRGSLSHLDGAFLLGFLWPVILLFLKPQSLPVYSFSQLRQIPTQRTVGRLTSQIMSWHPSFFGPQGAFPHMYSQEGLPDLRNEKYLASLSSFWAGLRSSLLVIIFTLGTCPWAQTSAWGPSISFLKKTDKQEKNKQKFINIHSSCTYGSTQ